MHLFMAREAVDKHLEIAGHLIDPEKELAEKLAALPKIAAFYGAWYPSRWLGWGQWPRYSEYGPMATHLRFVERNTRRLSRQIFHGMIVYQGALQNKQAFLFRVVDIANEMFAMAASAARVHAMIEAGAPHAEEALELADLFCRGARRKVMRLLRDLWANDDARKYRVALHILEGRHAWMEAGMLWPATPVAEPVEPAADERRPAAAAHSIAGGEREPEAALRPVPVTRPPRPAAAH
jgi:ACAD9/ACADV, C-terminal domain